MAILEVGKKAPNFELPNQDEENKNLEDYKGKWLVAYFYPRDDTPGCTIQACDFRDNLSQFETQGWKIFGISPDDTASHKKFKKKYDINFQLLSDPEHEVATLYGVWGKKKMYGREYEGIYRYTYVINEKGFVEKAYEKVSVKTHAKDVLAEL